jgi:hypothetical protein
MVNARDLRTGDLMRVGVSTNYVLVAKVERVAGGVSVTLYDGNGQPQNTPYKTFRPNAQIALSMRDASPIPVDA